MTSHLVYEWEDGSHVCLCFREGRPLFILKSMEWELHLSFNRRCHVMNWEIMELEDTGEICYNESVEEKVNSKIVGFLFELGLAVHSPFGDPFSTSLLFGGTSLGSYPRFTSDEEWKTRFDDIDLERRPYLLEGYQIQCRYQEISLWFGWPGLRGKQGTSWRAHPTMQENVEALLRDMLILPESEREAYDAAHVEKGAFLIPTPAEVDLYRLMGEPLPLLWKSDKLLAWLEDRQGDSP